MIIFAPHPTEVKALILPNPALSDSFRSTQEMLQRRAMDGTRHTYVKKTGTFVFSFTFTLNRMKALEVRDFYRFFSGDKWRIDFNNQNIVGNILDNPLLLNNFSRANYCDSFEKLDWTMEFEGTKS